ncbi:three-helix bundle dimerization domain-containing protein [Embleya sp. NPDC005575]|uniref:three-helix bundle dimerization domain-containing protein n=1 Tax=Embleya sp. NPDC005575 TaxID=3156892 RepID=UPI0033B163C2
MERADPATPPNLPSSGSHDEPVSVRDMVARLRTAYPSVDAVTVEATVRTAYDSFQQARIKTYVPILVERRSRKVLAAACRADPGQTIDGKSAAADPGSDAAVRASGGGRWRLRRLRKR